MAYLEIPEITMKLTAEAEAVIPVLLQEGVKYKNRMLYRAECLAKVVKAKVIQKRFIMEVCQMENDFKNREDWTRGIQFDEITKPNLKLATAVAIGFPWADKEIEVARHRLCEAMGVDRTILTQAIKDSLQIGELPSLLLKGQMNQFADRIEEAETITYAIYRVIDVGMRYKYHKVNKIS